MNYARIGNRYKYEMQKHPHDWVRWPRDGNIGDCIQSLAVKNLYDELGIKDIKIINRDDIPNYDGSECVLPMQSWFGNYAGVFPLPWSAAIKPVFIGFHLNKINGTREVFLKRGLVEKFRQCGAIGCRDRSTRDFLKANGINAYLSGCMTLTFPRRDPRIVGDKVFLVDLTSDAMKAVPKRIKDIADSSITHFYYFSEYPVTENGAAKFEDEAAAILERYKNEARLVITSKIHCAMPCAAMGIPVIFIHEDIENERFDILDGIVKRNSPSSSNIDWSPPPPDFERLKMRIKANAFFQIMRYKACDTAEEKRYIDELCSAWAVVESERGNLADSTFKRVLRKIFGKRF